ncbi:VanZ family protein [Actinoplanes sp. NPDC049265]|uniref:VanZ family protein n=1 Tax=Actinoplanes sp. NPDC049265 TaxID=3363902 RepID=UPI00371EEB57
MDFRESLWAFVQQPLPLLVLAAALALSWPLGAVLARRRRCSRTGASLFLGATGLVAALTLTPSTLAGGPDYPHFLTLLHHTPGALRGQLFGPPADIEQIANIALYVPIGVFGRMVWPSVTRATLVGLALTAGIELCQYDIAGRAGSLTDIRNNMIGAFVGALLTALAIRRRRSS